MKTYRVRIDLVEVLDNGTENVLVRNTTSEGSYANAFALIESFAAANNAGGSKV